MPKVLTHIAHGHCIISNTLYRSSWFYSVVYCFHIRNVHWNQRRNYCPHRVNCLRSKYPPSVDLSLVQQRRRWPINQPILASASCFTVFWYYCPHIQAQLSPPTPPPPPQVVIGSVYNIMLVVLINCCVAELFLTIFHSFEQVEAGIANAISGSKWRKLIIFMKEYIRLLLD